MRLDAWVERATGLISDAVETDSAKLEATVLLAEALGESRTFVLAHPEVEAPAKADAWLEKRLAGVPLPYIIGWREFWGRKFLVDQNVLIPRQETEHLIEAALALDLENARVVDAGTGSGCIGITLKLERPAWEVVLVDSDLKAALVAGRNAAALGADVEIIVGNWLFEFQTGSIDLVVSNPPYVAESDPLPDQVKNFEPHRALFADEDGLADYRRLLQQARTALKPGGYIALELGAGQECAVREFAIDQGLKHVRTVNDLALIPRVALFRN